MLRQFSVRRIIFFFLLDWLGSLAMLVNATALRPHLGQLPAPLLAWLAHLRITVGGLGSPVSPSSPLQMGTSIWGGVGGGVAGGVSIWGGFGAGFWPVLIAVAIIWPLFFAGFSVYEGRKNGKLWQELKNVAIALSLSLLALAGFLFLTYRETSRSLFLLFLLLDALLLFGSRLVLWAARRFDSKQGRPHPHAVLIVGAGQIGQNAVRQLKQYAWVNLRPAGYLDDDPAKLGLSLEGLPVLGSLEQAAQVVQEWQIQEALIALPLSSHRALLAICTALQGLSVRVHVIPDLFALSFPNAALDGFGGIPVLDLGQAGLQGLPRFEKRLFDLLAAGLILLVLSPVLLLLALLIKLDSPGPVIFRQVRIGENGKPFVMFKFRSMRADADPSVHQEYVTRLIKENLQPDQVQNGKPSLKLKTDARITRLGRLIRKTSLDELPQFVNVLRGEMSLVGPRPSLPYELEQYQDWHKRRLQALPGITGFWQVKARNRVSFDEMVRMDLEYIQHQSLWRDLLILLQTPWVALTGRGAG